MRRARQELFAVCGIRLGQMTFLTEKETAMGRGILLWLLGVPIPIIILILLFWR